MYFVCIYFAHGSVWLVVIVLNLRLEMIMGQNIQAGFIMHILDPFSYLGWPTTDLGPTQRPDRPT